MSEVYFHILFLFIFLWFIKELYFSLKILQSNTNNKQTFTSVWFLASAGCLQYIVGKLAKAKRVIKPYSHKANSKQGPGILTSLL